jgi:Transcriptional regulatory protein, C terminal
MHHAAGRNGAWVDGSPALLHRMADNVIENAIGHNTDGGWVSVITVTDGQAARLVVETGGEVLDQALRIHALARRQPTARARTLRAAGIELDPLRHTVTRDGRPVDLSVKEFGVLEALLRAQPALLSAEQLLEQVWDEFADPFTNTVTVTIGRLRRKLADPR